jgi:hypothetical protein
MWLMRSARTFRDDHGQTTNHLPGDYWTVKLGATMTVKALGEYAMFETIVLAKE